MSEKFYTRIWTMAISGIIIFIVAGVGSSMYTDYKVSELVRSGVNPIAAKHALRATSISEDTLAWMIAGKK